MSKFTNNNNNFIKNTKDFMKDKKQLEKKNNNDKHDLNEENNNILIEKTIKAPIAIRNTKYNQKMNAKNKGFFWREQPFNPLEQKNKPQVETQKNEVMSFKETLLGGNSNKPQVETQKNKVMSFKETLLGGNSNKLQIEGQHDLLIAAFKEACLGGNSNKDSLATRYGNTFSHEEIKGTFDKRRKAFYTKINENFLFKKYKQEELEKKQKGKEFKKEKFLIKKDKEFFRKVFNKHRFILYHFFIFLSKNFKVPFKRKKIFFYFKKKKYFFKYKNFLKKKGEFINNKSTIKIYLYLIKRLLKYRKFEIKSLAVILEKLNSKKFKSSSYLNINCILLQYLITYLMRHYKGVTTKWFNPYKKQVNKIYKGGNLVNIFEHMLYRAQLKYNYILKRGSVFNPETAFFSKNKLSFPYGSTKRDKKLLIKIWEENNPFKDFFAIPKYKFYYKNHLPFNRNEVLRFKKKVPIETRKSLQKQFPLSDHIYKIFERVPSYTGSKPLYRCTLHFMKNQIFFNRNHFLKSYIKYNVPNINYEFFIKIFEKLYKIKSKSFMFNKKKFFELNKKPFLENKYKRRSKNKKGYNTKEFFTPFLTENIKERALSYLHKKLKQPVNLFFFNYSSLMPNERTKAKCQYLNRTFRKSLSFQTKSEDFITMWLIALFNKNANFLTKLVINEIQKIRKPYFFFAFLKQFFVLLEQELKTIGIIGIKIRISGRFSTRTRAIASNIKFGKLPLQTLETSFDYCYGQAVTHYGATGIKVWIAYKSPQETLRQRNIIKSLKYNLKYNLKDQIKRKIRTKKQ